MSYSQLCVLLEIQISPVFMNSLTSNRGSCCKNESTVIVISGNWEYETGLLHVPCASYLNVAPVDTDSTSAATLHSSF